MKIKKLPAEARSKLQSGVVVTDALQCVLELVYNSLDAESTSIVVRIDLRNYQIQVVDNGKGMGKEDLELVGIRFMTSKFHNLKDQNISLLTYGFKGQAIASLLDVCKSLTIETKSDDTGPTFIKVYEKNKALPVTVSDVDKTGTGTSVTVNDFMCTMPVRRKRINEVFDIEGIKTQLQYLAVVHNNVHFTLRNENKSLILFQKPPTSSVFLSISSIYGKKVSKFLKPINFKDNNYEITGFVSVKSVNQNSLQLVYVNKRVVTKSIIHKFVNNLMKIYFENNMLYKDSLIEKEAKKLKGSFPSTFIILIKCSYSYYELYPNAKKSTVEFKNIKEVLKRVHKAIRRSLKFVDDSLDTSLDIKDFNKNDEDVDEGNEIKTVFGTSLLLNAVRGAPANRILKKKKKNKKEIKDLLTDEEKSETCSPIRNEEKSETCSPIRNEEKSESCNLDVESVINRCHQNLTDCTNDSLESPIPRNHLKSMRHLKSNDVKNNSPKESFEEFYKWLKVKFKTDERAFDLYNEFLLSNEDNKNLTKSPVFKSPVFRGRPKKRKVLKNNNTKKINIQDKGNNLPPISLPDNSVLSKHQESDFFTKVAETKTVTEKLQMPRRENLQDFQCDNTEFRNAENLANKEMFRNSVEKPLLRFYQKHIKNYKTLPSPASSELFFTNIIEFRNLSESFTRQSVNMHNPDNRLYSTDTNSWRSHYQEAGSIKVFQNTERRDFFPLLVNNRRNVRYHRDLENRQDLEPGFDISDCPQKKSRLLDLNTNRNTAEFRDAGIQANVIDVIYPLQKATRTESTVLHDKSLDADLVNIIPETPNFENKSSSSGKCKTTCVSEITGKGSVDVGNDCILSQEVPNPDFWNFPTPEELEKDPNNVAETNLLYSKKTSEPDLTRVNKATSSGEFVCYGQKTNTGTRTENESSASKETQTLAAMWTECLKEIDSATENLISKSLIEGDELPKTVPVEELCDSHSAPVESTFCLSERHDFVPKGLSPKNVTTEARKITHLNPLDNSRMNFTIDNSENELLASVKWQDESTGGSIKPTIPDGILDEMRQKAERNMIYYENEILSASLSYCAIKIHNLLHSFAFTKELLSGVEVIGQLDKKFIVTKMNVSVPKKMALVSLFDQHAVDERIKLEELMQDYVTPDGRLISRSLNVPIECVLNEFIVRLVSDLDETLLNLGLNIKAVNERTVLVYSMPNFLLDKHEKNQFKNKKDNSWTDIQALVADMINEIIETNGAVPKIPKTIHNAFCLEACRKAVKFNRLLTKETMTEMVNKLKNCRLPFQCAHGRPSVIPIIDLEDFKSLASKGENLNHEKLKQFMKRNLNNVDIIEDSGGVE